jgi:hypothetical protein
LEQFCVENNVNDLENIRNMCSENLNIFVKLFSLLYADDTIILSETEADMNLSCKSIGIEIFLNFLFKQYKALRA